MKISIPTPCHEDWNKMKPEEKGRFCLSCQKTVVDFTQKSKEEIKDFFQGVTSKVCGRFLPAQLQAKPIPASPKRKNHFFFIAIYFAFGGFLFTSCSTNEGKQKQGDVETMGTVQDLEDNAIKPLENDTMTKVIGKIKAENECTKRIETAIPTNDTLRLNELPLVGNVITE